MSLDHPRVSVIVPAYNAAATLDACIASVQAQDTADWELIVSDDGSSDDGLATTIDPVDGGGLLVSAVVTRQGENLHAGELGKQKKKRLVLLLLLLLVTRRSRIS